MKRQTGFTVIEIALVIVVLGLLAGVGFIAYTKFFKPSPSTARDSATQTRYTWNKEGLRVVYPKEWDISTYTSQSDGSEAVYIRSTRAVTYKNDFGNTVTGHMQVTLASYPSSVAVTPLTPPVDYVQKQIPVDIPNYGGLNIIEHGSTNKDFTLELALSDASLVLGTQPDSDDNSPYDYGSYQSKTGPDRRVKVVAGFFVESPSGGSGFSAMKTTDFEQQQDYQAALTILKSATY